MIEYQTNTGDCFISDKAMSEAFGVSDKTISRTLTALEEKGFIVRDTKSTKNGKTRHIKAIMGNIQKALPTDKLSNNNDANGQIVLCAKDKLSKANGQIDLIKDNIKDNIIKENIKENAPSSPNGAAANEPIEEKLREITMEEALAYWDEFFIDDNEEILTTIDGRRFRLKK